MPNFVLSSRIFPAQNQDEQVQDTSEAAIEARQRQRLVWVVWRWSIPRGCSCHHAALSGARGSGPTIDLRGYCQPYCLGHGPSVSISNGGFA